MTSRITELGPSTAGQTNRRLRFPSLTMSSPSKPVSIRGYRRGDSGESHPQSSPPVGTPDLRALRAQYVGTPSLPNIPPRGTPGRTTPLVVGTPSTQPPIDFTSSPLRPPPGPAVGGISAARGPSVAPNSGSETPALDLDGLPDEEKAKVLARHLVSKEERAKTDPPKNVPSSDASSSRSRPASQHSSIPRDTGKAREDSEAFPIPYDAPGADIT